ncbi:hypothetical protein CcaverHIS002_0703920 [Cutaneotrichosporon cavernicola]|uniref:Rap-GAP domain-containing protein n=1 Tax=Cutaneotrichosporon cavernicola TaxID=279322 RepID=A0AA48LAB6_9TREE|nr:uncharacterized protein CcaverHIS019_0704010 [Cutaneotrichosporon cavernicola]BEI87046.1 hypothetical protein CcaverHIS002_0703920 [Cutaneotrichosporon cavernicola]BEI94820.1 hypothetical protein CcaverHIS019_0704010 [Cutaneotrichosporon cavernicola]BEJ02595.1 hypothetical protein CcaverHIS631_0703900 [Cutaneotrichosporon cavernicola]BEJ10351.1 hypothetical protein CcaverHIS641_0703860 [Cutaneotrichosporon cavernicola]
MAERGHRDRDLRDPASPAATPKDSPSSSQAPSVHPLAFLPNLFGRRSTSHKTKAQQGVTRMSVDESNPLGSPPAGTVALPSVSAAAASAAGITSPAGTGASFDLNTALTLLAPGATKTVAELVEIVKATSVHLANALLDNSTTTTPGLTELGLSAADLRTLYARAMELSDPKQDYNLRTAAIRLLAVLLGGAPPRDSVLDENPYDLPASVSRRSIYRLITAFSGGTPGKEATNQIYVEVGALKALTREGTTVDGMEGLIGWMLRTLTNLAPYWIQWCSSPADGPETDGKDMPFGPIKSASAAAAGAALIDLLDSIVQNRIALFAPGDLSQIVRPLTEFVWKGIEVAPPIPSSAEGVSSPSIGHRPTPPTSSTITAVTQATRNRMEVRRTASLTVGRVEPFPPGAGIKPPKSPVRAAATRQVKWSGPFKSVCSLVHMLLENTTINDDVFDEMFGLLCFVFGQDETDVMMDADMQLGTNDLVRTMLSTRSGRRGELALRKALEGKLVLTPTGGRRTIDIDRRVTRGAVIIARMAVEDREFRAQCGLSFSSLCPSLIAAESTSRYPGKSDACPTEWAKWAPVDHEILNFLDAHLSALESATSVSELAVDDAWTEGEAASEVLDALRPVAEAGAGSIPRTLLTGEGSPLAAHFSSLTHRIPASVGHLNSLLHSSSSSSESPSPAPPFYHPKYIALLLDLGTHLDEDAAALVIDYYTRECLCLPFTSGWIQNIWQLLNTFGLHYDLPLARVRVSNLLYHDIYGYVQDLPEHRATLVEHVIVRYLSQWLPDETDNVLLSEALDVLVKAAVAETQEKDEDRRRARALKRQVELDAKDASPLPSQGLVDSVSSGSFNAIRSLITKLAMTSPCKEMMSHMASRVSVGTVASSIVSPASSSVIEGMTKEGRGSREGRPREPGGLRSLMRTLSPSGAAGRTSPPQQNVSAVLAQSEEYFAGNSGRSQHLKCKSLLAVKSLIAIFTGLAFTSPLAGNQFSIRTARTPASVRCIEIYRDVLHLLYSINDGAGRLPAKCPRGRLVVLQWAMRLRADRKHRILFRADLNRFVMPFAETLYRTKETEGAIRAQLEAEEARKRARAERTSATQQARDDDRGRSRTHELSAGGRSRSRSKAAGGLLRAPGHERQESYNPLWVLPEYVDFEAPPDNHPSETLLTYDPNHPSLQTKDAPLVEGAWLPVSEYVRVLNGILRWENDWELVSYVLCYLPQQLGNKHFFHGIRATREIKGLVRVLCDGILETETRWERRYNIPSFIRRPHINNMAYQSLSILVSYRSVLDRGQSERLVAAFVNGLEANALVAKPCIQALTICIYELEGYVAKALLQILQRVQQILSIPNVAVHILEFLVALGNSVLYRNFTDEQYRQVFAAAIGYIAEHNARSDTSDKDFAANRESFTLSQHVIGLAYHAIYLWFLNIRVSQRPRHVSYLVKGLLHAKSQRGAIDERTEVCFDWLARYTYGNADPKPAQSFLSEAVMLKTNNQEMAPKTVSWMLGGAIVTVTSHQRSGWATITTTRPTGQTSVVAKLENVPLLQLGEDNADLATVPAFLMANRQLRRDVNDIRSTVKTIEEGDEGESEDEKEKERETEKKANEEGTDDEDKYDTAAAKKDFDPTAVDIVTVKPPPPKDEAAASFVWSGATPSQRRKDVTVDPSYLALQLLSSYPNNDLTVPRGVLIPSTPKHERAVSGIIKTSVINTFKIAVLYVGPGQTNETEILGNVDGSPLFLDFLAGLGRIIRLKGQVDVFTGGMDRENDTDGLYAYAWWDDLAQMIFHAPTLMPNFSHFPEYTNKKRLVGNDYVKIIYNESGVDFAFDTIRTSFNFVNIVISPYATRDAADAGSLLSASTSAPAPQEYGPPRDEWGGDSEDFFKVVLQVRPGIPDFSPVGEYKLVSRRNLPILVRQIAHQGNSMALRFQHVQGAVDSESAEYITDWRTRWRSMQRLRNMLPKEAPPKDSQEAEELLRDFSRNFTPVVVDET